MTKNQEETVPELQITQLKAETSKRQTDIENLAEETRLKLRKKPAWYKCEGIWQRSPILLLLDKSIGFRLFLALLAAFLLLLLVSQVEKSVQNQNCKYDASLTSCLGREIISLVAIGNIDGFSIATVAILYLLESRARKKQEHYQAWQVIDNAAAAKAPTSYARFQALQDLNADGVSLKAMELSKVNLQDISLPGADLGGADLSLANLTTADLRGANLSLANFTTANLRGAKLMDIDLTGADLREADLREANLHGADLRGADLSGADLTTADLDGADLDGADLTGAKLIKTRLIGADLSGAILSEADFTQAKFLVKSLVGANLSKTNLSGTDNLSLEQIKSTKNWEQAIYSDCFRKELGLPPGL